MHFSTSVLVPLSLVLNAAVALPSTVPASSLNIRATPKFPSQDPFYKPPAGFENKKPGAILRHRQVSLANFQNAQAGYQVLYRTSDNSGNPEAAMTTIIRPKTPVGHNLLSYQVPYDSADEDCGPSYAFRTGANSNTTGVDGTGAIDNALQSGYWVNTPDYEGPKGAFTAGLQAGYATLDSVRAALQSGKFTGVSAKSQYIMWGYSGGALASEWAAELQSSYAPELKFVATVLGGLTPNVTSVLFTVNKGPFVGLVPAGIIGLSRAYSNLSTYLQNAYTPALAAQFEKAGSQCLSSDIVQFFGQDMTMYFKKGLDTLFDPIPQSVIKNAGIMGRHGLPNMPLYAYKGISDEISPIADTDALIKKFCGKGANITYVRSPGDHLSEESTGQGPAETWIAQRFNGVQLRSGCNITTETI